MLDEKLIEYLRSAREYCSPHPDLDNAQLLFEMERARRTLDYVINQVRANRGVSFGTPTGQAQT